MNDSWTKISKLNLNLFETSLNFDSTFSFKFGTGHKD